MSEKPPVTVDANGDTFITLPSGDRIKLPKRVTDIYPGAGELVAGVAAGSYGVAMKYRDKQDANKPRQRTEEEISAPFKEQIEKMTKVMTAIKEAPSLLATVSRLSEKRAIILAQGKKVEVARPADEAIVLKPGQTVKIDPETFGIISVLEDPPAGEIVPLKAVLPGGLGEIERGGCSRAIVLCDAAEVGDRVVVDDTGSVALAVLPPDQSSCIFGEDTGVTWDDIGGLVVAKAHMRDAVEGPFKNKDVFARFKKKPTKGVLLYGSPGNGKTMLGKAAASALAELHGADAKGGFYYVKGPELLNMYVGNTEANIRKMFDDARRHHKRAGFPAVIFIDEADAILGKRGQFGFGMEKTIVPQFLSEMDGLDALGALVIIATNRPDTLDPALVRDGRIDRRIHVTRPTRDDAMAIVQRALAKKPLESEVEKLSALLADRLYAPDLIVAKVFRTSKGELSDKLTLSQTLNGAMLVGIVERATSAAMRRFGEGIGTEDIERAVLETFNESLDIDHTDELIEHFGGVASDISRVAKGKPILHQQQATA